MISGWVDIVLRILFVLCLCAKVVVIEVEVSDEELHWKFRYLAGWSRLRRSILSHGGAVRGFVLEASKSIKASYRARSCLTYCLDRRCLSAD
jgi:hypothetical protein